MTDDERARILARLESYTRWVKTLTKEQARAELKRHGL